MHEAGGPGLGDPGAVDVAGDERVEREAVLLGGDLHVAATLEVGLVALVLQPGPERHVLRVAELGRRDRLAGQVLGGLDQSLLTTSAAPPEAAPDTTLMASPPDFWNRLMAGPEPM